MPAYHSSIANLAGFMNKPTTMLRIQNFLHEQDGFVRRCEVVAALGTHRSSTERALWRLVDKGLVIKKKRWVAWNLKAPNGPHTRRVWVYQILPEK